MNSAWLVLVGDSETSDRHAISKIPGEAWTEIFKWTLNGQHPFDISQTQEGPWPLGRICSWFRALVVSRSPIWTNFKLDVPRRFPTRVTVPSAHSYGHLLRSALDRSDGLPLTFTLSIRDISTGNILLPCLVKEIKRWKSAHITAPRSILGLITTKNSALNMARGHPVGTAKVLEVKISDVLDILPRCQELRRLRLLKGLITIPELADSSSHSDDPAAAGPGPEEEVPTSEEGSLEEGTDQAKITLANLEVLEFFDPEIISYLHAPSSRVLTIETTLPFLSDFTALSDFLTSSSTIRVLDVVIFEFDVNALAELFPLMPEVQDLQVKVCSREETLQGGADHLLDSLKTGLPMLKQFTSEGEGVLFSEEKLREVLETRKANGCALSRVEITSSLSIHSDK
ncbi:hypothetical protein EDD18DRAFT_1346651 [Armillaria luteobubalina]|uniref:F-box domain-containing protein n=1 Tax=Armillaria luteobubalina TaxID=153913 RepID=A0AA39UXM0_9AGAR|nr:hypothetical protein EDD18DRAFT_1346651 [Armillaria luteobubalina]